MTGRAATRYARWVVISVLALFVIDIAVPHGAKPWVLVCMAVAIVILLLVLGACWLRGSVIRKAGLLAPGIFAVCLLASIVYLRSLPDAAIPLVGVGSLVICLVGLATTGLRLRNR